jgi:DNA repair photolyase
MADRKIISGTLEWASSSFNCVTGCAHDCRYCYARHAAVTRFHTVKPGQWKEEKVDPEALKKRFGKRSGTIMFPTAHDITPFTLEACKMVLGNMLSAGNRVLIVSKPHFQCIDSLCRWFPQYKGQILFRFTIGASDDKVLGYWEPGAPSFDERKSALALAHHNGFQTSVSMEPCLDWNNVVENFHILAPHVTNSIWIGTMNKIDERVVVGDEPADRIAVSTLRHQQCEENFQQTYEALKTHPLVRWKESLKKVFGMPLADEAGTDQ